MCTRRRTLTQRVRARPAQLDLGAPTHEQASYEEGSSRADAIAMLD
jgi:hypothetical protein